MNKTIGAMAMIIIIGIIITPPVSAGTVSQTRNAVMGIDVGSVTAVSTTGGIMGEPAPSGVSHQGVGEAHFSLSGVTYRTPILRFMGPGREMAQDGHIAIVVIGYEWYQSDGDLQFAYTRVWVWGVSFQGGWYYTGPFSTDYVSSTCDAGPGMGFQ